MPDDCLAGARLPETFRVGPGPVRLHLRIENSRERRPIKNVIATLRGIEEPERIVLLSNHYDAWVYGAADPPRGRPRCSPSAVRSDASPPTASGHAGRS